MEKTLMKSNNDKEFMRMAMLKHEETFREQVNELHRLYRIQKMLMESVEIKQHQQQQKQKFENFTMIESSKKPFTIDHYQQQLILQQQAQRDIINSSNITTNNINGKSRINGNNIIMGLDLMRPDNNTNQVLLTGNQAQEHIAESNGNNNNNNNISNDNKLRMLDETDIELTLSLGPSSNNNNNNPTRRRKPGKSESGQSISSSSTGSSQTRKTSPKDSMSTTTWGGFPHQGSGIEPGFSNGQQNSNPPWLYQALSLKLT